MSEQDVPVDLGDSETWACQLRPNPDFISKSEFINDDGTFKVFTVTIERITREKVQLPARTSKEEKTIIKFAEADKRFVLGAKINIARIEAQHGSKVRDWVGKQIRLTFDPTVRFGPNVVGGVRVVEEGTKQ